MCNSSLLRTSVGKSIVLKMEEFILVEIGQDSYFLSE